MEDNKDGDENDEGDEDVSKDEDIDHYANDIYQSQSGAHVLVLFSASGLCFDYYDISNCNYMFYTYHMIKQ